MDFYERRDILLDINLERLMLRLPPFCRLYFEKKKYSRSKLTLQKDIYQLIGFFKYLAENIFKKAITEIDINDLKTITKTDLMGYFNFVALSAKRNYVVQLISVLNGFFEFYCINKFLDSNPVSLIDRPKEQRGEIIRMSIEESNRLLSVINNETRAKFNLRKVGQDELLRDKTIIFMFLSTGIRLSELVGLNYGNINMANKTILVRRSKSAKEEVVYMTDDLVNQLKAYFQMFPQTSPEAPLFVTKDGNRVQGQCLNVMVKKYAKFAGIKKKITPHKLRTTFGTNIYQKTHDIYMAAKLLGHTTVATTTKYYVDIDEISKRKALEGFRIA